MKIPVKISIQVMLAAAVLAGCTENKNNEHSERVKTMIANSKLAKDAHSYSKPNEARVDHLEWNAKVDFENKIIMV